MNDENRSADATWVTDWLREIAPDAYGKAVIGRLEDQIDE
jgi:hypothetical protein